jgi:hypothetical protein
MTKLSALDLICANCQTKGKTTIVGSILAPDPISTESLKKSLKEFLAQQNDAVFICNDCAYELDISAKHITGTKK